MSHFSSSNKYQDPTPTPDPVQNNFEPTPQEPRRQETIVPTPSAPTQYSNNNEDIPSRARDRAASSASQRPMSMIQTYHPSLMDVTSDTIPELQPIFTYLNSHSNKLYQEGYFLKLDDQNTRGLCLIHTFKCD